MHTHTGELVSPSVSQSPPKKKKRKRKARHCKKTNTTSVANRQDSHFRVASPAVSPIESRTVVSPAVSPIEARTVASPAVSPIETRKCGKLLCTCNSVRAWLHAQFVFVCLPAACVYRCCDRHGNGRSRGGFTGLAKDNHLAFAGAYLPASCIHTHTHKIQNTHRGCLPIWCTRTSLSRWLNPIRHRSHSRSRQRQPSLMKKRSVSHINYPPHVMHTRTAPNRPPWSPTSSLLTSCRCRHPSPGTNRYAARINYAPPHVHTYLIPRKSTPWRTRLQGRQQLRWTRLQGRQQPRWTW